ncbi:MAG TPA: N-acetyltransferase [Butyricimonas virosa]|uniref:N-acetyltransferase n=1 Tax=Butyricimonas virosa TaxID=544645 RepID=A0A921H681_9BACT|nr:N-acetyltransferase [Butyricimonas virosa]
MIRYFQQQDEDSVIRIWLEASAITHSFIPRSYWESKVPDMRNKYLPQSQTLVNEDEHTNEITGFISLIGNYIAALFVSPDRQGQGIGHSLMTRIKLQHPELELNVYAENTQALTFYKRQGFTITSEQTDEQTGRQEFTMKYQLDA